MQERKNQDLAESLKNLMDEARAKNEPKYLQLVAALHHLDYGFPSLGDKNIDSVVALAVLKGTYTWWGPVYQSPGLELVERLTSVEQIIAKLKTHPLVTGRVDEEMKAADMSGPAL